VLRERLGQERYLVLRYQCSPYHVSSALYPAIEQFERAAGFTREDSAQQKLDEMQAVLVGTEQQVAECARLTAREASTSIGTFRLPVDPMWRDL
jgi:predicted ATPase